MANATSTIREVRFVIEDELTHCYIYADAGGDAPLGVQGWHHKAFPASKSAIDILKDDASDYLLWGLEAPTEI